MQSGLPETPHTKSAAPQKLDQCLQEYLASDTIANEYDEFFQDTKLFHYDTKVLDSWIQEPGTLLDLGCGTGRHLMHFARRRFSVTGIDLSDAMLEICREKIQRESLMARLVRADMRDLSGLQDNTYSYTTCMFSTLGMLRGRENRMQVLREIYRVLKPGGRFAMHVHNSLYRVLDPVTAWQTFKAWTATVRGDLEFGDKIFATYRGINSMFLHTFTTVELSQILEAAGFNLIKLHPLNPERDGQLRGPLVSLRANGFLLLAQKQDR